ncbi:hypothetical protein AOQ84DRAFT_381246 [Glonium stellatum]|uniref:Uncharacterized protein n=1 Tax=Glonium stellatum TaxID=574774 RepID=A0A8E2JNF1_9PEZI|nr:hypothetical protein AOQ84DRAFT_381246 [Glonium stellatum]
MPRDGSGRSDNAIETGEDMVHGTQGEPKIYRAERTATPPTEEKGQAIEGLNASGGGSQGLGTGQGRHANDSNKPPLVDELTEGKK